MIDPKLIEAVARALEPKCRGFGAGDMPMAVAREFAQSAITAYEAARGDGVWVPRAEYLCLTAETRHKAHMDRLMSLEGVRESMRRNAKDGRAMIAAAKGE